MSGLQNMFDLRDESQAKEYLDTLGIEYRFQCYKEKSPEGCHRLADFFEAFRQDIPKARAVYTKNCQESNYGHSCFKVGNYNMVGKAGPVDMVAAMDCYHQGCKAGYMPSCHNAALMYHLGKVDGQRDYVKARDYLQQACEGNNAASCQLLSTYYISSKEGVPKDMALAFNYSKKSCEMGHMVGCVNLSQMYRRGEGTERNEQLADKYKERAKQMHKDMTSHSQTLTFGK